MVKDGTLDEDWRRRSIEVLNKADLLGGVAGVEARSGTVPVSAVTGEGLASLLAAIDIRIGEGLDIIDYELAPEDGGRIAWLYQHGEVMSRVDSEAAMRLTVRLRPADRARFERQ